MCHSMRHFGFFLFETLSFLDLDICFFPWVKEIFIYYFFE